MSNALGSTKHDRTGVFAPYATEVLIATLQGMLGETYDRFIAGDAIMSKKNPMFLPDDNQFHGIGSRWQYKMDNYWDTNHVCITISPGLLRDC